MNAILHGILLVRRQILRHLEGVTIIFRDRLKHLVHLISIHYLFLVFFQFLLWTWRGFGSLYGNRKVDLPALGLHIMLIFGPETRLGCANV